MYPLRLVAGAVLATFLLVFCGPSPDRAVDTSICSVVVNPESFDGRLITITACLESNGRDAPVLLDQACPGTTFLVIAAQGDVDKSVRVLADDLVRDAGRSDTFDRYVSGRFTGVFGISGTTVKRRTLALMRVRNVKMVSKRLSSRSNSIDSNEQPK